MPEPTPVTCLACGALVSEPGTHDAWHAAISALDAVTAADPEPEDDLNARRERAYQEAVANLRVLVTDAERDRDEARAELANQLARANRAEVDRDQARTDRDLALQDGGRWQLRARSARGQLAQLVGKLMSEWDDGE